VSENATHASAGIAKIAGSLRRTAISVKSVKNITKRAMLKIIKIDEVIAEANAKKITAYRIAKDTGLSTQTVYAYFAGEKVSVRTQETIINYINKQ